LADAKPVNLAELQKYITDNLLTANKGAAKLKISQLCKDMSLTARDTNLVLSFYTESKKQFDLGEKQANDPLFQMREAYSALIDGETAEEQTEQILTLIRDQFLDKKNSETEDLIKNLCKIFSLGRDRQKHLLETYRIERDEYVKKKFIEKGPGDNRYSPIYETEDVNNVLREWGQYMLPVVKDGFYYINDGGVFQVTKRFNEKTNDYEETTQDVCRTPFILCGISEPINGSDIFFKVRYQTYEGEIKEFWSKQGTLLTKIDLRKEFHAKGINLPEGKLIDGTIEYISLSIGEFSGLYKKEYSSSQCGWNVDYSIFVLGDRAVTDEGVVPMLTVGNSKGFPGTEKKGTLEGWMAGAEELFEDAVMRFKAYDAMSAPLKGLLNIESHISDHCGFSSQGKTLSSAGALSLAGNWIELMVGAKSTKNGMLVTVRDYKDLPLLVDETSDAGDKLADIVYTLTSGKARVKSTQDGQRDGGEVYRTSVSFTGEKPLRETLKQAGQMLRVVELERMLGVLPKKTITKVKFMLENHYGHIIDMYMDKVFLLKSNGQLQEIYNKSLESLPEMGRTIEERARDIFACIMTAGHILELVFAEIGFPTKNSTEIVQRFFVECIGGNEIEYEHVRALRELLDWTVIESGKFVRITEGSASPVEELGTTYGYIEGPYVDIVGSAFIKKMKVEGFAPVDIRKKLVSDGVFIANQKNGVFHTTRGRNKENFNGVRIDRVAAEAFLKKILAGAAGDEDDGREKRKFNVIKTVKFLGEIERMADLGLLKMILGFEDLDALLEELRKEGRILPDGNGAFLTRI
jgi:putative DNA primase/helicase